MKFIHQTMMAAVIAAGSFVVQPVNAAEVYMIRGFLNVFSDGMNQMAKRLRSAGIKAKAVSAESWESVGDDIIRRAKAKKVSYPIVLAGHSLGGVSAPKLANKLGAAGVPVALVIGLDPGFPQPPAFRKGARQVLNYKLPGGKRYRKGSGFKGSIRHIDVSKYGTDHVGIDKNPRVQAIVIKQIRKTVKK